MVRQPVVKVVKSISKKSKFGEIFASLQFSSQLYPPCKIQFPLENFLTLSENRFFSLTIAEFLISSFVSLLSIFAFSINSLVER